MTHVLPPFRCRRPWLVQWPAGREPAGWTGAAFPMATPW